MPWAMKTLHLQVAQTDILTHPCRVVCFRRAMETGHQSNTPSPPGQFVVPRGGFRPAVILLSFKNRLVMLLQERRYSCRKPNLAYLGCTIINTVQLSFIAQA